MAYFLSVATLLPLVIIALPVATDMYGWQYFKTVFGQQQKIGTDVSWIINRTQ